MKLKERELLLIDICARLPYGVMMGNRTLKETSYRLSVQDIDDAEFDDEFDDLPYLRPTSSMTEDESKIYDSICINWPGDWIKRLDFYLKYHFDYRGLIEKGLALEAPEGMYK